MLIALLQVSSATIYSSFFFLECHQALGLEDNTIQKYQITTVPGVTAAVQSGKEGYYARLNNGEAWCIGTQAGEDVFADGIYVQINLRKKTRITALALQGFREYSYGKHIKLSYKISGMYFNYVPENGASSVSEYI